MFDPSLWVYVKIFVALQNYIYIKKEGFKDKIK